MTQSTIYALLLAANAVLLATAVLAILRLVRRCRQIEAFWTSPTGAAVSDEESGAASRAPAHDPQLERRVAELQSVVRTLARRSTEAAAPTPAALPLDKAVRMAKRGATVEQLISTCGLNVGEARLMHKLHSRRRGAPYAA